MQVSTQDRTHIMRTGGVLALVLVLYGCGSSTTSSETQLLQTGQASYPLVADQSGVEVTIDYTFSNQTGYTVYLPNCRGGYFYRLERLEGGAWVSAWNPDQFLCLSEPITIEAGQTFSDTIRIWGTQGDPAFERVNAGGTFRIVWAGAVTAYAEGPLSEALLPLEHRVSNAFELLSP